MKRVDPTVERGVLYRAYARLVASRPGGLFSRLILWRLDPVLMRRSGGRFGLGLGLPTALLETRGARSGLVRSNALIYFHDGDNVVVVASKLGMPEHPGWLHNLRAHPEVVFGGSPFQAREVTDEAERSRLWLLADRVFPPYAMYRKRAARSGRTIPLVQLVPR